jgi:hypothetical protein
LILGTHHRFPSFETWILRGVMTRVSIHDFKCRTIFTDQQDDQQDNNLNNLGLDRIENSFSYQW